MPRVRVVDDSPAATIQLTSRSSTAFGFGPASRGVGVPEASLWIEGAQIVAAPSKPTAVKPKFSSDKVDGLREQFDLPGEVQRAQNSGDATFVEVADRPGGRSLWWCGDEGPQHVLHTEEPFRWEVVASGVVLVVELTARRLLVSRPGSTIAIALPPQIDCTYHGHMPRYLYAVPQLQSVVLVGKHRASIFIIDELLALRDRADWTFDWIFPYANLAASERGTVTMSKYGRTNIELGAKKIQIGATPLVEGEAVELRGLLWDRLSSTVYRDIVRADGSVIPYPGAPDISAITTPVTI